MIINKLLSNEKNMLTKVGMGSKLCCLLLTLSLFAGVFFTGAPLLAEAANDAENANLKQHGAVSLTEQQELPDSENPDSESLNLLDTDSENPDLPKTMSDNPDSEKPDFQEPDSQKQDSDKSKAKPEQDDVVTPQEVDTANAVPLTVGETSAEINLAEGEKAWFSFTPAKSGVYKLYSNGNSDTYCRLYDADSNQLAYSSGNEENSNFLIKYNLTSNQTYYYCCSHFDSAAEFTVTLEGVASSGTCGENHNWNYNIDTSTLSISGSGAMFDYYRYYDYENDFYRCNYAPWYEDYGNIIKTVIIGNGVTSIGNFAFYRCSSLTSVTIPDSVTSIGDSAFYYCDGLTSVTIPDSVASIGDSAFYYCYSLLSVTIPDSVTSIADYAFYNCDSLTSVKIGNSVTNIGRGAFNDCSSLPSVTIGKSVTSIGDYAFYNCSSLTNVTIPDSVTSLGDYVFAYCRDLENVTMGNSVTSIGDRAFEYCIELSSLAFPHSVNEIGESIFLGCSSLLEINVAENNNAFSSIDGVLFNKDKSVLLIYPQGITEKTYIIPDSVITIGESAFRECSSLTEITIPDSVTTIGGHSFYKCSNLSNVSIGNGVLSIAYNAFSGCKNLQQVTLGSNIVFIGDYVFFGCESLHEVIIPASVKTIGNCAFDACKSLSSITIPAGVTIINSSAFNSCTNLSSITIPDSISSFGYNVFANTKWYDEQPEGVVYLNKVVIGYKGDMAENTAIVIKEGTKCVARNAFYNCSNLSEITIPDSIISVGSSALLGTTWYNEQPDGVVYLNNVVLDYKGTMDEDTEITLKEEANCIADSAFSWSRGLSNINFGTKVTNIGDSAFSGCTGLNDIVFPKNVERIGEQAFAYCNKFTKVSIPVSVTDIAYRIFAFCDNLQAVTIPQNVISIGYDSFRSCNKLESAYLCGDTPKLVPATLSGAAFPVTTTLNYIQGKSGWTTPTWNGYNTATFVPEPDGATIADATVTAGKCNVTIAPSTYTELNVLVASYNADGKMLSIDQEVLTGMTGAEQELTFDVDAGADSIQIFMLDTKEAPVCPSYSL